MTDRQSVLVEVLDDGFELSLLEICRCCTVRAETVIGMVEEGLLEPQGNSPANWRFNGPMLRRVEVTLHLQRDLRVNLPGAALALDLLDEVERLRGRLARYGIEPF